MLKQTTPLRVHVLIDSLNWGGAEMLLTDFAAAAASAGIEMSVGYLSDLNGSPAAIGLRERGIEPRLVGGGRLLDIGAVPRLRAHLRDVGADILHTHLELSDVLGSIAARSLGLPSVSTIHLVVGQPSGQSSDGTTSGRAKARVAAFVRRHAAARVLAVSGAARDAYVQTGWDTPPRVIAVHNGIARAPRKRAGERVRRELGLAPDALVLTTVTVLRPGKGHAAVFAAVRHLLPDFPGLRLVVLGDGPARDQVHALAEPLGDAAILPGHVGDVMGMLDATDVLLHPTQMDAFPTALLEAAAARVPVVATRVGGIPEIVEDGLSGYLIDAPPSPQAIAERLTPLLEDERLRHRMGDHARDLFTRRFTAERWASRLRQVYDEVLAERSSAPAKG